MNPTTYAVFIDLGCIFAWLLIVVPVLRFYFTGWAVRRDKLMSYLSAEALEVYYQQFPWKQSEETNLPIRFKNQFNFLYGRQHFLLPTVALFSGTALIMWATARTVESWLKLAPAGGELPKVALSALLGGIVWVLQDELDRIRRRDLVPMDVYNWVFRLLVAVPFGFAFAAIMKEDVGIPIAFLLGAFPTKTLFTMARRLTVQKVIPGDQQQAETTLELEKLQSVGKANAERFEDEGVNTIATLAWIDPIDLTIRTNFDFNYVLDCMSQALLWVYFEDKTRLLFPLSLRGAQEATGLVHALEGVTIPLDPQQVLDDDQKRAAATLKDAAKVLNISEAACMTTLTQVAEDPYSVFIGNVWS